MNEGAVVGVVGVDTTDVERATRESGATPLTGTAASVAAESDYLVALGESALLALARTDPGVPVLPVAAGRGVRSVPRSDAGNAIRALLDGPVQTDRHPQWRVTVGDRTRAHVLTDLMLVTAEPAEISEYAVAADGEPVDQFRADGVVLATPAGSSGYAHAAGGPVVPPETDASVIVPVAPFATDTDHWVVPSAGLTVTVERDESAVQLIADDRVVGPVDPGDRVRVSPDGAVETAVVPASRSCFDRDR
jgi:NAD+ kinase